MWLIKHLLLNKHFKQFIKFCLVGFANTFLDYGVYVFFTRIVGLYFMLANIISILVAMVSSFIFNKYWTFENTEKEFKKQSAKFIVVNMVYFFLNNAIVYLFVEVVGVYDLLAKVAAIIVGLFWNFFANKLWVFAEKKK